MFRASSAHLQEDTVVHVSDIKTSQLMLYREIIAVCSQIHKKHINTLCGQNVEFLSVKPLDIMITRL